MNGSCDRHLLGTHFALGTLHRSFPFLFPHRVLHSFPGQGVLCDPISQMRKRGTE